MQHSITGGPSACAARSVNPRHGAGRLPRGQRQERVLRSRTSAAPWPSRPTATATSPPSGGDTAATATFSLIGPNIPGHLGEGPAGRRVARQPGHRPGPAPGQRPHAARAAAGGLPLEPDRRQGDGGARERLGRGRASTSSCSPIAKDYFTAVSVPGPPRQNDVVWSNWAADWPSGLHGHPAPVRQPGSTSPRQGPGRDYGHFSDAGLNEQMAAAGRLTDPVRRDAAWAAARCQPGQPRGLRRAGPAPGAVRRRLRCERPGGPTTPWAVTSTSPAVGVR